MLLTNEAKKCRFQKLSITDAQGSNGEKQAINDAVIFQIFRLEMHKKLAPEGA